MEPAPFRPHIESGPMWYNIGRVGEIIEGGKCLGPICRFNPSSIIWANTTCDIKSLWAVSMELGLVLYIGDTLRVSGVCWEGFSSSSLFLAHFVWLPFLVKGHVVYLCCSRKKSFEHMLIESSNLVTWGTEAKITHLAYDLVLRRKYQYANSFPINKFAYCCIPLVNASFK